jgi:hypothetical protein
MKYLITIYFLIIIIQYSYSKYYKIKFNDEEIIYNNKNYDKLFNIFNNVLQKRRSLLENNKMSIDEWFEYGNKNTFIIIDGYKYYLFIDELVEKKNIIQRVYGDESYNDLSLKDMLKLTKDTLIFTKYTTTEDMEINAYDVASTNKKEGGKIKYFWIDPISNNPTLKESLFMRWDDPNSKRTGLMGIGISLEYLNQTSLTKYIDMIHKYDLLYISLISFIIAVTIHFTEKNKHHSYIKSILFLIISNSYILTYINKYEGRTTIENELSKIKYINSGALSVAFLAGVNIYIIGILSNNTKSFLYIQSAIVFALSISLLMISILQYTNLTEINYMIGNRLSNELLFNFSIILNMVILINFILHTMYNL